VSLRFDIHFNIFLLVCLFSWSMVVGLGSGGQLLAREKEVRGTFRSRRKARVLSPVPGTRTYMPREGDI
jgi:hypothetical protein